ncbi:hypothetical protein MZK41_03450 [Salmonella enterica subsp. enterica serovar Indiana]|uniref:hypothetical protein n=1 Tax=Salmonella enterica TaxID=28901 RepID=UPI002003688A|nr:hypothetical protein [Salmonella enterica]UPO12233.1 hypothetical protein MZK41_03450 [Salmonella enterica subsp. enterica serovar Indiana]
MAAKWQQTYSLCFHIPHYSTAQGVEIKVTYCFISFKFGTHNRLVVGSNPTGATIYNKGLANKSANPFSFAFELGQVMGQVSFFSI